MPDGFLWAENELCARNVPDYLYCEKAARHMRVYQIAMGWIEGGREKERLYRERVYF